MAGHRHSWRDAEMIGTLKIARLPTAKWANEISKLTNEIKKTDPNMDEDRVRAAVNAAANALGGSPDAFPKASKRLRELIADGH